MIWVITSFVLIGIPWWIYLYDKYYIDRRRIKWDDCENFRCICGEPDRIWTGKNCYGKRP